MQGLVWVRLAFDVHMVLQKRRRGPVTELYIRRCITPPVPVEGGRLKVLSITPAPDSGVNNPYAYHVQN